MVSRFKWSSDGMIEDEQGTYITVVDAIESNINLSQSLRREFDRLFDQLEEEGKQQIREEIK